VASGYGIGKKALTACLVLWLMSSLDHDPLICGGDVSGGGAAWNVSAFRRGGDARSILRIRIPGEHTRDRSVRVGKLAEILRDTAGSQGRRNVYRYGVRLPDL
jgi:hypothetical protein